MQFWCCNSFDMNIKPHIFSTKINILPDSLIVHFANLSGGRLKIRSHAQKKNLWLPENQTDTPKLWKKKLCALSHIIWSVSFCFAVLFVCARVCVHCVSIFVNIVCKLLIWLHSTHQKSVVCAFVFLYVHTTLPWVRLLFSLCGRSVNMLVFLSLYMNICAASFATHELHILRIRSVRTHNAIIILDAYASKCTCTECIFHFVDCGFCNRLNYQH